MRHLLLFSALITLLAGCASQPEFDTSKVDPSLTPQHVAAEPQATRGKIVLWGGTILGTHNLEDKTQIEILAYPLSSFHRPLLDNKPLGRFIIQQKGFLEPSTFEQGRVLTVLGSVSSVHSGQVGETPYSYPVINAQQIHLWSKDDEKSRTSFHFGIGVRL